MSKLAAERYEDQPDEVPVESWPHRKVWERVREALFALPSYFRMEGNMPNIPASDLHSANTLLGAAIEEHIPVALNLMRSTWDPESEYADCLFRRQPKTFPDVQFRRETTEGSETLFGIEIKSWYILAKEAEPSFRLDANKEFCAPHDLVAIYPWAFSAAVSGTPRLFRPLVLGAKKAARLRNEFWIGKAKSEEWAEITSPEQTPVFYPTKSDRINDTAPRDTGNNFGRIARTGVWTTTIDRILREEAIAGIPLLAWQRFLAAFKEKTTLDETVRAIDALKAQLGLEDGDPAISAISSAAASLGVVLDEVRNRPPS
jgi:hypothetical protein